MCLRYSDRCCYHYCLEQNREGRRVGRWRAAVTVRRQTKQCSLGFFVFFKSRERREEGEKGRKKRNRRRVEWNNSSGARMVVAV